MGLRYFGMQTTGDAAPVYHEPQANPAPESPDSEPVDPAGYVRVFTLPVHHRPETGRDDREPTFEERRERGRDWLVADDFVNRGLVSGRGYRPGLRPR